MRIDDLAAAIAEKTGLSRADAKKVILAFTDIVSDQLATGNQVKLTGFGTFSVRERQARMGTNPQTGQKLPIPAQRTPGFAAGATLKAAVR
jgi:DNA-binding protein HU-beta